MNRYDEIKHSVGRKILANEGLRSIIGASVKPSRPCVFLSHKSEDKKAVNRIADYFRKAGVDYYLDINDENLQRAVKEDNQVQICEFIELGIANSTHLLTIVSQNTKRSWWVPFEVGYGKRGFINLAHMPLSNVVGYLPSFLQITRKIGNMSDLNTYITELRYPDSRAEVIEILEQRAIGKTLNRPSSVSHPLRNDIKTN